MAEIRAEKTVDVSFPLAQGTIRISEPRAIQHDATISLGLGLVDKDDHTVDEVSRVVVQLAVVLGDKGVPRLTILRTVISKGNRHTSALIPLSLAWSPNTPMLVQYSAELFRVQPYVGTGNGRLVLLIDCA